MDLINWLLNKKMYAKENNKKNIVFYLLLLLKKYDFFVYFFEKISCTQHAKRHIFYIFCKITFDKNFLK